MAKRFLRAVTLNLVQGPWTDPGGERVAGVAPWMLKRVQHDGKRQGGFTLIEMMVALAVFSLAAMALIRLEGATIRSTGILDDALIAQMVARNVAVETLTDAQPPALGESSGTEQNGGRAWNWTRETQPLGGEGVLKIDITVAAAIGPGKGHLTIIRPPATGGGAS